MWEENKLDDISQTAQTAWYALTGMNQLMAGGGVALIGTTLVPLLAGLFG